LILICTLSNIVYTLIRQGGKMLTITITIIVDLLFGCIVSNYTKKPEPTKLIQWMKTDIDNSGVDYFEN